MSVITAPAADPIALHMLAAQQDSPLLVALFDPADELLFANASFRRSYGLAPHEALSWSELMQRNHAQSVGALIQTDDFGSWLLSTRSRRGKQAYRSFEADLCDGRWIWMTETMGADGCMLCVGSDITELKVNIPAVRKERDTAQRAAQTDALTGISNHAHVTLQLAQRLEQLHANQTPCAIALVDLDGFKKVNDTHGHAVGDSVLQHFAQTISARLRREDCFGRVGGEEFLLLFPGMEIIGLAHTMPRLLDQVRQSRPLPAFPDFFYTCSAGMGALRPDDTARGVYQRVGTALQAAKAAGGNCCMWAA